MTYVLTTSPPDPVYEEVAAMLAATISETGSPADIVPDEAFDVRGLDRSRTLILVGDGLLFSRAARQLGTLPAGRRVALWQLEPIPMVGGPDSPRSRKELGTTRIASTVERVSYRLLRPGIPPALRRRARRIQHKLVPRSFDHQLAEARRLERALWIRRAMASGWLSEVFVSAPDRIRSLASFDVPATFVPIGYHPMLDPDIEDAGLRDVPALFLGRLTGQRRGTISALEASLGEAGIELKIEQGPIFGSDRAQLLSRTRVSICPAVPNGELARFRVLASMAAGAAVVAEKVHDTHPFEDSHLALVSRRELAPAVLSLLGDEESRRGMADRAHDFLVHHMSMRASARTLLGST